MVQKWASFAACGRRYVAVMDVVLEFTYRCMLKNCVYWSYSILVLRLNLSERLLIQKYETGRKLLGCLLENPSYAILFLYVISQLKKHIVKRRVDFVNAVAK